MLRSTVVAALLALVAAAPAAAQWDPGATAMLGAGHGFTALSQSTMGNAFNATGGSGGRGGGSSSKPKPAPKPKKATPKQLRALRYTPDPAVTAAHAPAIAQLLVATCPPEREGCPIDHVAIAEQLIASGDHRTRFRTNVRAVVGGTDRNVADAISTFIVVAWAAQGPDLVLTDAEERGARRTGEQVRNQMALQKQFRRMPAARKQEIVEVLGAIAQHSLAMRHTYTQLDATEQADDLTEYLRDVAEDLSGIDVADVRLKRSGFVER